MKKQTLTFLRMSFCSALYTMYILQLNLVQPVWYRVVLGTKS